MFTKNIHSFFVGQFQGSTSYNVNCINFAGNTKEIASGYWVWGIQSLMQTVSTTVPGSSGGVFFGNGTTAPTADDYTLAGDMLTNLSCSKSVVRTTEGSVPVWTGVYTVTNTGDSDFTVSEVCLFANRSGYAYTSILLDRTLLDSPITIPAGGIGVITYTIRLPYPMAEE